MIARWCFMQQHIYTNATVSSDEKAVAASIIGGLEILEKVSSSEHQILTKTLNQENLNENIYPITGKCQLQTHNCPKIKLQTRNISELANLTPEDAACFYLFIYKNNKTELVLYFTHHKKNFPLFILSLRFWFGEFLLRILAWIEQRDGVSGLKVSPLHMFLLLKVKNFDINYQIKSFKSI